MSIFTYVFAFLVAIGVLVAVHEFGHFWVARRLGVRVVRFSIGFGRPLWRRRARDGTEYMIAAIPLGGYVKLLDEREGPVPAEQLSQAYNRQPVWRRVLVLLAGPAANFVFAVCAYWVLFAVGVPALKPVIGEVAQDSIAARAGLAAGDEIVAVGGRETHTREATVLAILDRLMQQRPIEIELKRADTLIRQIDPQIETCKRDLARAEIELEKLQESVTHREKVVAGEEKKLKTGAKLLSGEGTAEVMLASDSGAHRRRINAELGRTKASYVNNVAILKVKRALIERQARAVDAAKQRLLAVRTERVALEDQH